MTYSVRDGVHVIDCDGTGCDRGIRSFESKADLDAKRAAAGWTERTTGLLVRTTTHRCPQDAT